MSVPDPTTPDGIRFLFGAEAEPAGDDPDPCVFCNHPQHVRERKVNMAYDGDRDADLIPDGEAKCPADYVFTIGHADGEHRTIPVCEGCMHGMSVAYGNSDVGDLPYVWEGEVCLKTRVPSTAEGVTGVNRRVSVAALADLSVDIPTGHD